MFWLYAIALALCSLIFSPYMTDWAREPKEIFLLAVLASTIIYQVWKKNKILAGFIAWVLLGMWWSGNLLIHACAVTKGMSPVFDLWVNSIGLFILGIGIWYLVVQRLNTIKLCEFICLGAVLQASYGLCQAFSGYLCTGIIGNQGVFNEFLAICMPLFLFIDKKYLKYLGMGIVLLAMIISKPIQSHDIGIGTLALIPGGFYILWKEKRERIKIIVPLLLVLLFVTGVYFKATIADSMEARFCFWKDSIHYGSEGNKILGWGLGNYKQVMTRVKTSQHTEVEGKLWEAHNEYIQIWFETGYVGLLIALVFLGNIARRTQNICFAAKPLVASFIMILFISVLSFPFHVASTAFIAFTIITLLEKEVLCQQ